MRNTLQGEALVIEAPPEKNFRVQHVSLLN